ncbi:MAG: hypothetical protein JOZ01_00525 [Candidatus Eremiobacteraeota bacterium]|nr:hypothetical protein [Candidatus Eremiobacteraeota bacterium]
MLLLALAAAIPGNVGAAPPRCTQETLPVRGTPVTVAYCITGTIRAEGDEIVVPVIASYASPAASFNVARDLHFVGGEGSSRILQSLELNRIGMSGVLHLTLVYAAGAVRVEGALLTPGGITIK